MKLVSSRSWHLPATVLLLALLPACTEDVAESQAPVSGVDPETLVAFQSNPNTLTLIDARSPEEYSAAHIPGAINVPFDAVEAKASLLPTDKEKIIIVHCRTGRRAGILKNELDAMGYTDVQVLPSEQIEWGDNGPVGLNPDAEPAADQAVQRETTDE